MARYAIIESGLVDNIIEADAEFIAASPAGTLAVLLPEDSPVGIGWAHNAGNFGEPTEPEPDIGDLKAVKNTEINAERLAASFSTFTHAEKVFSCDQLSRSDIDGTNGYVAIYAALPPGWPGAWKAADNSYYPIADVAAWKLFYASMCATGAANFAHAQDLKLQLADAETAEEIAAITW